MSQGWFLAPSPSPNRKPVAKGQGVSFIALVLRLAVLFGLILLVSGALAGLIVGVDATIKGIPMVLLGFAVLGAIGLVGWGIQILGDRLFGLPLGTTARYLTIGLMVAFVLYFLTHPGDMLGPVEF